MNSWGNVPLNSVIPFFFDTFGASGESLTLTGLAAGDIEVYKGTSMTQRSSDNGFTLLDTDGIDIDSRTGIHGFSIDTSDNTDSGFYAAGSFYTVVIDAVTINAQTVRFVAGTFRLVAAEGVAGVPDVNLTHIADAAVSTTTAQLGVNMVSGSAGAITAAVIATGAIDADAIADNAIDAGAIAADAISATKIASGAITSAKFAAGAIDATAIANGAIDAATFAADVDAEILSYIVDDATRIDASALNTASVTTIPAILTDTAEIGAAGAGLTAINLPDQTMNITGNITGNLSGSVGSVTGAVGSVTGDVGGKLVGTIGGLTAGALADFFDTDSGKIAADAVAGSVVFEIGELAGSGGLTVQDIVDGVWDEPQSGHTAPGTFGLYLDTEVSGVGGGSAPTASEIADEVETRTLLANVIQISGDATAADNLETMLDGTGGKALTLGSLTVDNSGGSAVVFKSSGGNGHGLSLIGNGTGEGLNALGGADGSGIEAKGGATGGNGLIAIGTGGFESLYADGDLSPDNLSQVIRTEMFTEDTGLTYAADAVAGSVVFEIVDNAGGGSAPTVGEIVDGILDESLAGHAGAGTVGANLNLIDEVKAKTDNLPSDPADQSLIIAATNSILADTNAILADTGTDGVVVAAGSKTGYALSSAGVTAIWAEVVDGTRTAVQLMRGFAAALLGKVSGGGTTNNKFRNIADTKDVIDATVTADGDRTAVTTDLT